MHAGQRRGQPGAAGRVQQRQDAGEVGLVLGPVMLGLEQRHDLRRQVRDPFRGGRDDLLIGRRMLGSRRQIQVPLSCGSRKMSSRYIPVSRSRTQVWVMTSKAGLSSGHRRPDPMTSMSKSASAARRRPNWPAGTAISRSSCCLVISPRNRSSAQPAATHHRAPAPASRPVTSRGCQASQGGIPAHLSPARRYPIISHDLVLPAGPHETGRAAAPRQG